MFLAEKQESQLVKHKKEAIKEKRFEALKHFPISLTQFFVFEKLV